MKTKNLDEGDASKSLFAGAARYRNHPFSKTTPFADISVGVEKYFSTFTQGSPLRGQPWAERLNPVGIAET